MRVVTHRIGLAALAALFGNAAVVSAQYSPPIGIPAPPFGINESHQQYAGLLYAAGGFTYRDAGNGPYTHYVDGSAAGCTNTTYGTSSQPRCTIPTSVPAGSVVEIHGGPYVGVQWSGSGTVVAPVYYRGANASLKPLFDNGHIVVAGTYTILENLDLKATRASITGSNISVRFNVVHDHPGTGSLVTPGGLSNVVYSNEIYGNGGVDRHGVGAGGGASDVWILNNNIHNNSGDGIQFCHSCINQGNGPANVYIGRNQIHDDHENAIDVKETRGPVIISQNDMSGYVTTSTSNGEAIRINDEGNQGEIWIIANRIHDGQNGIQPSRNHSTGVFIIGNLLYNLTGSAIRDDAGFVVNNTIYNVGTGINSGTEVRNNLIMTAATHIANGVAGCSNNLAYQGGGGVSVSGSCASTTNANPLFVNPAAGDFRIQSGSPARNTGTVATQFARFLTSYGRSIAIDYYGGLRPQEGLWDIGGAEFGGSTGTTPAPSAPTNVRIIR